MGAQGKPHLQLNPHGSWTGCLVAEEETQRVSYLIPTCHLQLNEKNLGPVNSNALHSTNSIPETFDSLQKAGLWMVEAVRLDMPKWPQRSFPDLGCPASLSPPPL